MPRQSQHQKLHGILDEAELALSKSRLKHALENTDSDSMDTSGNSDLSSDPDMMVITPPSPMSPLLLGNLSDISNSDISNISDFSDSESSGDDMSAHYDRLHDTIMALHDEIDRARILHQPGAPPLRAPQLSLLDDFAGSRPHLFRKKLRVNPEIFDDILDQISDHGIFTNQSNNPQLPVAIQLAIFLNRAGHYGNAISPEDVGQWAGVSVGSVINCTNRVMIALLDQHDTFISFPTADSEDAELARKYSESKTCPEWRNGILAMDGTAVDLYTKPGFFGETFYDRKSRYSISCQVSFFFFIFLIMKI
jgi:hypothetical protein